MSARAPAEYCARDESAAARIIEVEQSAYHLACRIEPRDIASTDILHIGVGRNLDAAESEGHAAGDGISLERRLVDRIRPIRFWNFKTRRAAAILDDRRKRHVLLHRFVVFRDRGEECFRIDAFQFTGELLQRIGDDLGYLLDTVFVAQQMLDFLIEYLPRKLPFLMALMNGPLKGIVAAQARKQLATKARREHYPAPYAILDLWQKYDGDPFAPPPGDRASVATLIEGDTARNLIRIFFLQERMKALGKDSSFTAKHVHIIGAGVMGGDIAAVCAMRGLTVTLQDQNAERIAPAMQRAAQLFQRRLRDKARIRDATDRMVPDITGDGARHADVIIEAIFENLEAKRALFANLEKIAKPGAIMATNTSSLKLADIAANLARPSRLVGIHFFNPVPQMQLVEIVSAGNTDAAIAGNAAAFVRQIDKLPLHVKDAAGFLVNRVLGPYIANAFRMADEGIAIETIDAAMEQFGMPMGPIELADTVGLDICVHAGTALAGASAKPPKRLMELVNAGKLGKKTAGGFYQWIKGKPQKQPAGNIDEGLIERLIRPCLDETQKVVAEGIVADADLADAGLIFGTGFAPFRGGPMHHLKTRASR